MAAKIQRLPEDVANQIAAGEVVERPASVVKELVENALDAGASRIEVQIEGGGLGTIRVFDDGSGMGPEDAALCLERHATSKIRRAADLFTVATLGFRGEALPSIASVSRFVLTTRSEAEAEATRLSVEGGRPAERSAAGAPKGTSIQVSDLFFNVPARRKFLKQPGTEMSHITDAVVRLALAHERVAFKLSAEGRSVLDVPAGNPSDPLARIARILGRPVADRLHPIPDDGIPHRIRVEGFVSAPELSERTSRSLYSFVNQRFVRERTIQAAIAEGYRTLLEKGRYPTVVLFLSLDANDFDVNVHPQKTEVRFARTSDVFRAVSGALGRTLAAQPWIKGAAAVAGQAAPVSYARHYSLSPAPSPPDMGANPAPASAPGFFGPASYGGKALGRFIDPGSLLREAAPPAQTEAPLGGPFSSLEPIGQALGTYLVCQAPGRVVLIDQHAAHERLAFERMRNERKRERVRAQPLLVPITLELDPARSAVAAAERTRLAEVGVELEPFGGETWLVKSAPTALGATRLESLVIDLLDDLKDMDESTTLEERVDGLLSCAACHTVLRAGDRVTRDEIKALLVEMDAIDFGAHCPHGRPVFVEWSEAELERLFHRR